MLSFSMIVRNEEARLAGCLASVRELADEMVVVDTGSTDATIAVAEAAGARVEQMEWPGDFAPARNTALTFFNGDWVLVLDADEQLRPEVIPSLKALMVKPDVLVINLLRYEVGAAMTPYSSVSRLFRCHPAIRWSRPYHSMIDDSVGELMGWEPQWRIADCSEPAILHYGYRPELLAGTDNAACHQNRAVALLLGGDIEGARAAFRTAITLLERQGRPVDAQALRSKAQGIVKLDMEPIA